MTNDIFRCTYFVTLDKMSSSLLNYFKIMANFILCIVKQSEVTLVTHIDICQYIYQQLFS
jgi:hypothetical protein